MDRHLQVAERSGLRPALFSARVLRFPTVGQDITTSAHSLRWSKPPLATLPAVGPTLPRHPSGHTRPSSTPPALLAHRALSNDSRFALGWSYGSVPACIPADAGYTRPSPHRALAILDRSHWSRDGSARPTPRPRLIRARMSLGLQTGRLIRDRDVAPAELSLLSNVTVSASFFVLSTPKRLVIACSNLAILATQCVGANTMLEAKLAMLRGPSLYPT